MWELQSCKLPYNVSGLPVGEPKMWGEWAVCGWGGALINRGGVWVLTCGWQVSLVAQTRVVRMCVSRNLEKMINQLATLTDRLQLCSATWGKKLHFLPLLGKREMFMTWFITVELVLGKRIKVEWMGEGFVQWSAPLVREIVGHWELISHKRGNIQVHYTGFGVVEKQHQVAAMVGPLLRKEMLIKSAVYTVLCLYRNNLVSSNWFVQG
jgi:hypothetical protein